MGEGLHLRFLFPRTWSGVGEYCSILCMRTIPEMYRKVQEACVMSISGSLSSNCSCCPSHLANWYLWCVPPGASNTWLC